MEYEYPIDLDWSNEEMLSVITFFNHVEKYYESGVNAGKFMQAYKVFKSIVPGKAEVKQIFNTFEKVVDTIATKLFKMLKRTLKINM